MISKLYVIICCLFMLSLSGCYRGIAEKMIKAPNYGKTLEEVETYDSWQFEKLQIDDHFKVAASEEGIFLDVGVIEPKSKWEVTAECEWFEYFSFPSNQKIPDKMYWERCPDVGAYTEGLSFTSVPEEEVLWQQIRGTVILVHGLWMDKTLYAFSWGQILSVYGYRVILVDLRGHGRSTGDYITFGSKESDDIVSLIDSLEKSCLLEGQLILFGESLGAAVAIETAAIDDRVTGVIAISPFVTIRDAAPHFSKQRFSFLNMMLGQDGIDRVIDEAGDIGGFSPDANTPLDAVEELEIPVLFIHGSEDKHVPCMHSIAMSQACHLGTLEIIEGKGHMNITFANMYSLRDKIINWLETIDNGKF
ncbi:MAG: alpha/beta hydrolase [Sedimentisphaeraceae bacterium JB056]